MATLKNMAAQQKQLLMSVLQHIGHLPTPLLLFKRSGKSPAIPKNKYKKQLIGAKRCLKEI